MDCFGNALNCYLNLMDRCEKIFNEGGRVVWRVFWKTIQPSGAHLPPHYTAHLLPEKKGISPLCLLVSSVNDRKLPFLYGCDENRPDSAVNHPVSVFLVYCMKCSISTGQDKRSSG